MHHHHIVRAIKDSERPVGRTLPGLVGHDVQFYRTDEYLTRAAANFLAEGVRAGQPLVVFATPPHRAAFIAALRGLGLDTEEMLSGREAVWLDARETMDAFMEGRLPNRELFMATVGSIFERLLRKRNFLIVRGYGEMVDLLARDGNHDGALELEKFWNELAEKYPYSLLCGYSLDNFLHESGATHARRVCHQHTRTLPPEELGEATA